ncbi:hypothetical protein ACFL0Q_01050 [Thermodesulfobacteriota bacterium]
MHVLKNQKPENREKLLKESTVSLIERIVSNSDRLALEVLFESRKLFRTNEKPRLSIIQHLIGLRDKLIPPKECDSHLLDVADCAYDLTLAKYSNFPNPPGKKPKPKLYHQRGDGVDCRLYYLAVLNKIQEKMEIDRPQGHIKEEEIAGLILQGLVTRNFNLSKLECERFSKFTIRYAWEVSGKRFYLQYPSYMTPQQFKEWLIQNTQDIDLMKSDARIRIQSLINEKMKSGHDIQIDKIEGTNDFIPEEEPSPIDVVEGIKFTKDLADSVAKRKVRDIDKQRPVIRKLGKDNLECLINDLFKQMAEGEFEPGRIARKYGISKSTFSRFAGSKWSEINQNTEPASIPDLWRNTAKVLAGNPIFMETVIRTELAGRLKRILYLIEHSSQKGFKNAT